MYFCVQNNKVSFIRNLHHVPPNKPIYLHIYLLPRKHFLLLLHNKKAKQDEIEKPPTVARSCYVLCINTKWCPLISPTLVSYQIWKSSFEKNMTSKQKHVYMLTLCVKNKWDDFTIVNITKSNQQCNKRPSRELLHKT